MENKKNNKNIKLSIIVALLFVFALYFIGNTYAKYAGAFNGEGELNVAKWQVRVSGEQEEGNFDLTLTPESNGSVVADKIAPGVKATGTVKVDLTDTEVAVDLAASIDQSSLSSLFGGAKAKVTLDVNGTTKEVTTDSLSGDLSSGDVLVPLKSGAKFTEADSVTVKITVEWVNETNGDNDSNDTSEGETATTVTIPVKLTAKQHIEAE